MATSEILGLFATPEQYQQSQRQAQEAQAIQYANLSPRAKAEYGFYSAGQRLGSAIGGALGGQDPQLQLIAATQQLTRSANLADPASLEAVAQQLANIGNMPLAISYADRAKALREEKRKGLESGALISLRGAQADKAKRFEQQVAVSKENRDLIASLEEKIATDPTYDINAKENALELAKARFILGKEMKTQTLKDNETGALLGTIEGIDINFSAPNLARLLAKQQPVKSVEGAAITTDGVVATPVAAATTPPVAEAIPPADVTPTPTPSKVTVRETPSSIIKAKKLAEEEAIKVEELKRESEGFQEGLSAIKVLRGTIADTRGRISKTSTGFGALLSFIPESDALTVSDNTQTIKDNIALAKLKELKQQSKTGASGLGALNMKEFDAIQGIIARLNPKSANYAKDLQTIDDFFARAEELMAKQGARAEERVVNRPNAAKPSAPSGGITEQMIQFEINRQGNLPQNRGVPKSEIEKAVRAKAKAK
jgi:hypothetical protein